MKKKQYYICHPFETYGDPKDNLKKEEELVDALKGLYGSKNVEFVRPFKLIPHDISRDQAMSQCLELLNKCDGIILAPDWNESEGCRIEYDQALAGELEIIEIKKRLD